MSHQFVLIIEDDRVALDRVAKLIASQGYAVKAIDYSEGAKDLTNADRPDLLIMNPVMPRVSMIEVATRLQKIAPCKVILLSRLALDPDVQVLVRSLEKQGCDCAVIGAYFKDPQLLECVRAQIGPAAERSDRSTQAATPEAPKTRPATTKTVLENQALLEMANLSIYEKNAFHLTGLPVDASARQVSQAFQKLEMTAKGFGSLEIPPGSYSSKMPSAETVREALQSLSNPEKRLLHEFFWFWPMENPGENDVAYSALSRGEILKAEDAWNAVAVQQSALKSIKTQLSDAGTGTKRTRLLEETAALERSAAVGLHNLAVLNHIRAISTSLRGTSTMTVPCTDPKQAWDLSLGHWVKLWNHNLFWDLLIERVHHIRDPRLTSEIVQSVWSALPIALLSINAEFAVAACERGDFDSAAFHKGLMNKSGFDHRYVHAALMRKLDPLRKELEHLCTTTNEISDRSPKDAIITVVREFLLKKTKYLQTFNYLLGAGDQTRDDAHDLVAQTARLCLVEYGNNTNDWEGALPFYEDCLHLAKSAFVISQLEQACEKVSKLAESARNARRTRVTLPGAARPGEPPHSTSHSTPPAATHTSSPPPQAAGRQYNPAPSAAGSYSALVPRWRLPSRYAKSLLALIGAIAVIVVVIFVAGNNNSDSPGQPPTTREPPAPSTPIKQTPNTQTGPSSADERRRLERECDAGSGAACNYLGWERFSGNGAAKDYSLAASLYSRACSNDSAEGCSRLGSMYDDGDGIPLDFAKAVFFSSKGCDAGSTMGCFFLGTAYEEGHGVAQDYGHAMELYSNACTAGDGIGCAALGRIYELGLGIESDTHRAKDVYRKACELNSQFGCKEGERLR